MDSDFESYCCQESDLICDQIIGDKKVQCVTEIDLFKNVIENKEMLELGAYGAQQKHLPKDTEGNIKPEGLMHTAYRNCLNVYTTKSR